MANRWGKKGNRNRVYLEGGGAPKSLQMVTCSHDIKRHLLLGRKVMMNLDIIFKSRNIILPTNFRLVKAMVFPVVMYRCESWTIKEVEFWRVAFELWCWRRPFFFFLLYSIVLALPYINMHPPWVYTCSPSWTPLPPPSPYHPSGSSQCTSPKLSVSCIEPGLAIRFLYDIHVLMPFSQIIPPFLSHKVQKAVLYICVSFAVSHTGLSLPSF